MKKIRSQPPLPPRLNWTKKPGITLITSIVVSGIILTLVLTFMKVVLKDIQLNADFFQGERAYFAAESGVEHGLLLLKSNPTQHITTQEILLPQAKSTLSIKNQTQNDEVILDPLANLKISLRLQNNKNLSVVDLTKLKLKIEPNEATYTALPNEVIQWKILCRNDNQTTAIQGSSALLRSERNFSSFNGTYDQIDGASSPSSVQNFWTLPGFTETERQSCYLSFQNLTDTSIKIYLSGTAFVPIRAQLQSIGQSNHRQKIIGFELAQKNLDTVFDFGIFDQNADQTK